MTHKNGKTYWCSSVVSDEDERSTRKKKTTAYTLYKEESKTSVPHAPRSVTSTPALRRDIAVDPYSPGTLVSQTALTRGRTDHC